MAEQLKHVYDKAFIAKLCDLLEKQTTFDSQAFTLSVFNRDWESFELKQRMYHITQQLNKFISGDYQQQLEVLIPVSTQFGGFEAMFFPDFVEQYGLDDYAASILALEHFTKYSSSEFAVRPFIEKYPCKMMLQMKAWTQSEDHHVRRLASEGCRPRLPWAKALPAFKQNPSIILPILEALKNDPSEYVRKSVANNLNDISKDNPDVVINIAWQWKGKTTETDWIIKHACRSLLKQAQPDIMSLYGYQPPNHIEIIDFDCTKQIEFEGNFSFSFQLSTNQKSMGLCRLEFALYFMKKNNKQTKKIFKISESNIQQSTKFISKTFSFITRSTRRYYAGQHSLGIIVNGFEKRKLHFILGKKKLAKN
ncbi:MAG: DNA alkylation repair protein [Gammaproteobacteria bacterium]|nr:DNA alkylation repair protein [Gammaproteobacteria bacterium]